MPIFIDIFNTVSTHSYQNSQCRSTISRYHVLLYMLKCHRSIHNRQRVAYTVHFSETRCRPGSLKSGLSGLDVGGATYCKMRKLEWESRPLRSFLVCFVFLCTVSQLWCDWGIFFIYIFAQIFSDPPLFWTTKYSFIHFNKFHCQRNMFEISFCPRRVGGGGQGGEELPQSQSEALPPCIPSKEMTLCTGVYEEPPFWSPTILKSPPLLPLILKSLASPLYTHSQNFVA